MLIYILCGGNGTRLDNYSFPKPLNMIYGKPSIYYCLEKIPENIVELHFIVSPHLKIFNFENIVINLFKNKKCIFHYLPYFTRGPIESAILGLKDCSNTEENIVLLDNDVIYNFTNVFFEEKDSAFLGFSEDNSLNNNYSFLKIDSESYVTEYKEKIRISNLFCCGVYGFKNILQFRTLADEIIKNDITGELYLSLLYQKLLSRKEKILGFPFENCNHIGTLNEIYKIDNKLLFRKMRICFDLDNTLVTYPQVPNDYSTVKPIENMISILQKLKMEGHTIIIYTARRMLTHGGNIGKIMQDIGKQTFDTLEKFNIPYDEIVFGKPIADMYIDDKAINPYRCDMKSLGLIDVDNIKSNKYVNVLPTNKYNNIEIKEKFLIKKGLINGELYYYQNLPINLLNYFPRYHEGKENEIVIEYIDSISFYSLYNHGMITEKHLQKVFEFIDKLHQQEGCSCDKKYVINNYIKKLEKRFEIKDNYPFEDAVAIQEYCLKLLRTYCESIEIKIVPYIHGDLWFSNILLTYNNEIKVIDMKGKMDNIFTTSGDIMYDYGKLYQSILGYDKVLYNYENKETEYTLKIKEIFYKELEYRNINLEHLKIVTFALTIGTLHFIKDLDSKERVWRWINKTFL
jgi:capsule biosynthesis phosphatase